MTTKTWLGRELKKDPSVDEENPSWSTGYSKGFPALGLGIDLDGRWYALAHLSFAAVKSTRGATEECVRENVEYKLRSLRREIRKLRLPRTR